MNPVLVENGVPRRIRIDLNTPVELSIREAMRKVEELPPDVRLTDAVNKLAEALNLVSDFEDDKINSNA